MPRRPPHWDWGGAMRPGARPRPHRPGVPRRTARTQRRTHRRPEPAGSSSGRRIVLPPSRTGHSAVSGGRSSHPACWRRDIPGAQAPRPGRPSTAVPPGRRRCSPRRIRWWRVRCPPRPVLPGRARTVRAPTRARPRRHAPRVSEPSAHRCAPATSHPARRSRGGRRGCRPDRPPPRRRAVDQDAGGGERTQQDAGVCHPG